MKTMSNLKKSPQKLEHFSSVPNLKEIDPKKMGSGADARTKQRTVETPYSFYYRAGKQKPAADSHIHEGTNKKYTIEIPDDAKLYDIGTDPEGHIGQLRQHSMEKQVNPGVVTQDEVHGMLKELGYHGFYHSAHPDQGMENVVGLYHSQPVKGAE